MCRTAAVGMARSPAPALPEQLNTHATTSCARREFPVISRHVDDVGNPDYGGLLVSRATILALPLLPSNSPGFIHR
jgi:hypothetical protein